MRTTYGLLISAFALIISFSGCSTDPLVLVTTVTEGDFTTALPSPPTTNGVTTLTAQFTTQTIFSGKSSKVLGYQSGSILGPTMVVNTGDVMSVNLQNNLSETTNIHWHGLVIPANMDGHPENVVQPGGSFTYTFTIAQRAGMYWYHPHPDGHTAKQAYLGLAGAIIVRDAEENALNLPSGEFE
ncbi:MAG: multicopper oxidase family protein, partial [Paludibacter sp.]